MTPDSTPCRALRRIVSSIIMALTCAAPLWAHAEVTSPVLLINADAATAAVTTQKLRGNVSVLMGSGGNITVLTGPGGKLLVDGGIAVSRPRLEAALNGLGPMPIKYLIDTHYHWDHTDGNAWLHDVGATIIAHENTLKRLTEGTRVIPWGFTFPPVSASGLPTVVFKTDKTMQFEGETLVMTHTGAGHTDTDVAVYLKTADVLSTGDLWWKGHYPFIDYNAGGGIDQTIQSVNACIEMAGPKTLIVPGHGPVGDRAALIQFRDMLVAIRANVARAKKQGKTLAETVATKPTAAFDSEYGDYLIGPAFFTMLVYMGV